MKTEEHEVKPGIENDLSVEEKENLIKIRDDREPVIFLKKEDSGDEWQFDIGDKKPSWLSTEKITLSDLRHGIEPWLTSLVQSEHLSLLTGTGLSTAIEVIAKGSANSAMAKPALNTDYTDSIEASAKEIAKNNSRGEPNIEDYIRVINELLRGLKILGHDITKNDTKKNKKKQHEQKSQPKAWIFGLCVVQ